MTILNGNHAIRIPANYQNIIYGHHGRIVRKNAGEVLKKDTRCVVMWEPKLLLKKILHNNLMMQVRDCNSGIELDILDPRAGRGPGLGWRFGTFSLKTRGFRGHIVYMKVWENSIKIGPTSTHFSQNWVVLGPSVFLLAERFIIHSIFINLYPLSRVIRVRGRGFYFSEDSEPLGGYKL